MAAVRVSAVTAEGSDLNCIVVALAFHRIALYGDKHYAELSAYGVGLRKDADDLMRRCRGRDIVVSRFAVDEQITHAAADQIGGVAMFAQRACDASGFHRFF